MNKVLLLSLSPLFLVAACGDDNGGGTTTVTPFESTATDDEAVDSLSADEQTAFCNELKAYADANLSVTEMKKLACYSFSIAFSGGDRAACQESAQACMDDPESIDVSSDASCEGNQITDCSATVAELESCYTAQVQRAKSVVSSLSCSSSPESLSSLSEPPAACNTVKEKCPKLFEDSGE